MVSDQERGIGELALVRELLAPDGLEEGVDDVFAIYLGKAMPGVKISRCGAATSKLESEAADYQACHG
jgi:hypothetical protein